MAVIRTGILGKIKQSLGKFTFRVVDSRCIIQSKVIENQSTPSTLQLQKRALISLVASFFKEVYNPWLKVHTSIVSRKDTQWNVIIEKNYFNFNLNGIIDIDLLKLGNDTYTVIVLDYITPPWFFGGLTFGWETYYNAHPEFESFGLEYYVYNIDRKTFSRLEQNIQFNSKSYNAGLWPNVTANEWFNVIIWYWNPLKPVDTSMLYISNPMMAEI